MSDILKDFAGKAFNIPDEQIAAILYAEDGVTLKEDALSQLLKLDSDKVKSIKDGFKPELTKKHDEGYQKAQGESLSKYEIKLKEEFGITDSKSQGSELVKEIIAKFSKDMQIDEEKIKLHPKFIEMERKLTNEYVPKSEYEKVTQEFDGYKSGVEKEKVMAVIKNDALKAFRSFDPVLPTDPTKALNQELDFLNKLGAYEYEVQSDGSHIIKIDGKRLENAQGHPVSFNDFVRTQADKYFDFKKQDGKSNSGNQNNGGSGTGTVTVPNTKAEYLIALNNETDPKQKIALMHAWTEKNK